MLASDFEPDRFEPNDTIRTATTLGSVPAVTLRDLTVHSAEDVDYFRYTANQTGLIVVNAFFDDDIGDIDLRVLDSRGNILDRSETPTDDERLTMPVISQQIYYVEVFGFEGATNRYDLEIETTPAPVPSAVVLDAQDDTGLSNDDNVTNRATPRVLVQADLRQFLGFGIPILDAAGAAAGSEGAAVEVFVNGNSVGFADPVVDATLFALRLQPGQLTDTGLPIGSPDNPGSLAYLNLVTAAVRIIDPQVPPFTRTAAVSTPLSLTFDPNAPDAARATVGLLPSSDSGVLGDGVTKQSRPAFGGLADAGAQVRLQATNVATGAIQIVGRGTANSDESDSQADGLGTWEITAEPLADGVYDIIVQLEDRAGNVSTTAAAVRVEIDTQPPNTPRLDLLQSDDTGRHNDDNITRIAAPLLSATTHDPNGAGHLQPANFIYRIFDRTEPAGETLRYDSFAQLGDYTDRSRVFTTATGQAGPTVLPTLADGTHGMKLEVEDRAGNVSEDYLLDLVVDTQPFLGSGRLQPTSDTGIPGFGQTMIDRVTRDTTPAFFGVAEADNLVIVRIDGVRAGTAMAVPLDGDDAFQPPNPPNAPVQGNWQAATNTVLDDGEHTAVFTFEDVAGNQVSSQPTRIMVDSQGPRVTNITYGDVSRDGVLMSNENTTSMFRPKPAAGPDPLISSMVVHFSDGPQRTANFRPDALFADLAEQPGHFQLVGDANGNIPILAAIPTFTTIAGQPAVAQVELIFHDPVDGQLFNGDDFGAPLPDDRYTLTIADTLTDAAGNALDGESGAAAPFNGNDVPSATPPIFPTGDGSPGGQLVARLTVDSRPEIGTWGAGGVWIDTNGNLGFDPDNQDFVHRDLVHQLGFPSDDVFAGNFAAGENDPADGFDKLAAYGRVDGSFRWLVDTDNDGVPDVAQADPANANGLPVAGRFDDHDVNGDEVGVYTGSTWYLDTDHDFQVDLMLPSRLVGYPMIGDFDGDGFDDLATWADNTFQVDLARGIRRGWDGIVDATFGFGFAGVRERPVAADWDQDGLDDLGLWVPDGDGSSPSGQSDWYLLRSSGKSLLDQIVLEPIRQQPVVPFEPEPLGNDLFAQFGDSFALPLVGNFDPPIAAPPAPLPALSQPPEIVDPLDVNGDGLISPLDALLVINALESSRPGNGTRQDPQPLDVNLDGSVSPLDALLVINRLTAMAGGEGPDGGAMLVDTALAELAE